MLFYIHMFWSGCCCTHDLFMKLFISRWNLLRTFCANSRKLGVGKSAVLELLTLNLTFYLLYCLYAALNLLLVMKRFSVALRVQFSFTALELPTTLPSDAEIQRWCGEPVKAAIIPTGIFLTNKKGFDLVFFIIFLVSVIYNSSDGFIFFIFSCILFLLYQGFQFCPRPTKL